MNDKLPGNATSFSVDKNGGSISTAILWITFCVALVATILLYMQSRSVQNAVAEKEATRDEIISQLSSPSYIQIEKKANAFSEAFDILTALNGATVPKKDLLAELYTYFTKDVSVDNLSLSKDGSTIIDGKTASYRAVADFMTALKGYSRVSDIVLSSVALAEGDDVAANEAITFSISFSIDTAKQQPETLETTNTITDNESGGESETVSGSGYDEDEYEELDPMDTYN